MLQIHHTQKQKRMKFAEDKDKIELQHIFRPSSYEFARTHNLLDNATTVMAARADLETD